MTDQVLDILKLVLLALLYLFFARVLWAVWSEVRRPIGSPRAGETAAPRQAAPAPAVAAPGSDGTPTIGQQRSWRTDSRPTKPPRGRHGVPARLEILEPKARRGTVLAIGADPITVGRDLGNTLTISDDEYISSHHATVACSDGQIVVTDHASKNGTYLNGQRITQPRALQNGDRVQFGATVLEAQ